MTGSEGMLSRGIISDGCRDRYVSIAKAKMLLGYEPRVSLEEGIRISCQVSCVGEYGEGKETDVRQHYQKQIEGRAKR
jgi:sterol-4alpha-carboxylate 3-dehydrogenase (decarboxylating)